MFIKKVSLAISLAFLSSKSLAIPVTLQSDWESSKFGRGTMTFTFEDDALATTADGIYFNYTDAIKEFSLDFSAESFSLDKTIENSITMRKTDTPLPGPSKAFFWVGIVDSSGEKSNLQMYIDDYYQTFSGALGELIKINFDEHAEFITTASGEFVTSLQPSGTSFHQVTEPNAIAVFVISLCGVAAIRRFSRNQN